jgi:hypothetical protein
MTSTERRRNQSGKARQGAVLLCDALGFKGLWRDNEKDVFKTIQLIHRRVEQMAQTMTDQLGPNVAARFHAFSDTIAFIATSNEPATKRKATLAHGDSIAPVKRCIALCAMAAQIIQRLGAYGATPLAYRGAISAGRVVHSKSTLLGAPVDEAAAHMNMANGAIIRIAPSATDILDRDEVSQALQGALQRSQASSNDKLADRLLGRALLRYRTPLVDGSVIDSRVVNPIPSLDEEGGESTSVKLYEAMGVAFKRGVADPRVEVKAAYTSEFLNHAFRATREREQEMA